MNDSALNNYEHTLFINSSAKILKVIDETVRIFDLSENKSCSENAIDILYAYEAGENLQKYMGTWLVCFIAIVGILLNILCIYALFSKEAPKNLFNMLLINILSWDTIFLVLHLARRIIHQTGTNFQDDLIKAICSADISKGLVPLWNIALAQSVFATLILSMERYICVVHEETYTKYMKGAKKRRTLYLKCILPVTIIVFLVHIPEFVAKNTEVRCFPHAYKCDIQQINCLACENCTDMENVSLYFKGFTKVAIDGLLPLICLIYCNIKTFLEVRKTIRKSLLKTMSKEFRISQASADQNQKLVLRIEHKLAKIMVGIVSVFILCQIPYLILTASQSIRVVKWLNKEEDSNERVYPSHIVILEPIVYLLLTISCSVNVFFYCFFDSNYRNLIMTCLKRSDNKSKKHNAENKETLMNSNW